MLTSWSTNVMATWPACSASASDAHEEDIRAWDTLAQSVLDLVFLFLKPIHLQNCLLVCKHWRWAACQLVSELHPKHWDAGGRLAQVFPHLKVLEFRGRNSWEWTSLQALQGLQGLSHLTLVGHNGLLQLDRGLSGLPLVTLDLSGCLDLPSEQLHHLSGVTTLRSFSFSKNLGAKNLVRLVRALPHVEHLSLKHQEPERQHWDFLLPLTRLTALTSLVLDHCSNLSNTSLMCLTHLAQLRKLSLVGVSVPDMLALRLLTNLLDLNLAYNRALANTGLVVLSSLTQLESLNLQGCRPLAGSGLNAITHLTSITALNVRDLLMTVPLGSQPLTAFVQLQRLAVSGATFVMTSSSPQSQLVDLLAAHHGDRLTHLDLSGCLLFRGGPDADTRSPLSCLSSCTVLRDLLLDGTRSICDLDFTVFVGLKSLRKLALPVNDKHCMEYTDKAAPLLAACTQLQHLVLDLANLSPTGIHQLSTLRGLTQLVLAHSPEAARVGKMHPIRVWEVLKAVNRAFGQCVDIEVMQVLPDLSSSLTPQVLANGEYKLEHGLKQAFLPPHVQKSDNTVVAGHQQPQQFLSPSSSPSRLSFQG